jgi:uncharacterized protein YgbK (DUF1537 family)
VGSVTELTQRQLEALALAHDCHVVRADCALLVNPATRGTEMARVVSALAAAPAGAGILGVCTAQRPEHVWSLHELGTRYGLAGHELSRSINEALAEIALQVLRRSELRLGGLYSSGGEVTETVTRKLQAAGLCVRDEVLPLAMYGSLIGGPYSGLPIVTKGGFVGDAYGLAQCMDYLIAKISAGMRSPYPTDRV